jgi:uncharacterized damage-inducible protein DinB
VAGGGREAKTEKPALPPALKRRSFAAGSKLDHTQRRNYKMNANAFRHFCDYHFAENRKIWDRYVTPLSHEQLTQDTVSLHGSARSQVLHLISADDTWFSQLRGVEYPVEFPAADLDDRNLIRAHWDNAEQNMRNYLAKLRDAMFFEKPFPNHEEDNVLILWQVLLHVVNHGTDHRAQLLRLLNDLGVETESQDYVFYVYGHP